MYETSDQEQQLRNDANATAHADALAVWQAMSDEEREDEEEQVRAEMARIDAEEIDAAREHAAWNAAHRDVCGAQGGF